MVLGSSHELPPAAAHGRAATDQRCSPYREQDRSVAQQAAAKTRDYRHAFGYRQRTPLPRSARIG